MLSKIVAVVSKLFIVRLVLILQKLRASMLRCPGMYHKVLLHYKHAYCG
jgi:propanediol dehydratase large subunit